MSDPKLARRYAEGLYEAAKDKDVLVDVMDAMGAIHDAFQAPELRRFWTGPQVPQPRKLEVVDEAFADAPELVRNFLKVLIEKKREGVLLDVYPALSDLHDQEKGVVRAILTTAIDLEEDEATPFVDYLKKELGGEIVLSRKVDPSVIAGFRLRFGDRIIDASVERSISEIRRRVSA